MKATNKFCGLFPFSAPLGYSVDSFLVVRLLKQSATYLVCLVCVCVDQNKATPPPAKVNFDVYRFDLTKLTPSSQNFTGAFHHVTPCLLQEILMSTDLTPWLKISQMHSITIHQYTNIKCRATQC